MKLPVSPRSLIIPILAVLALIVPFLSLGATAAQAKTVDVVQPDSIKIENGSGSSEDGLTLWQTARISFDWDATGSDATAGDTFGINLPAELAPVQDGLQFPLLLPDGETSAGTCTVNAASGDQPANITCEFNDFVDTHENVKGNAWFAVQAIRTTEETTVPVEIIGGSDPFEVDLPGDDGIIGTDNGDLPVEGSKQGWFIDGREKIWWTLYVLPTEGSTEIELTDVYDEELTFDEGSLVVSRIERNQAAWDAGNWEDVTEGVTVDSNAAQHTIDVNVANTSPDYVYRVNYATSVNDPGSISTGDTFENKYTYEDTEYSEDVTATQDGAGSADGDQTTTPTPTPSETPTPTETPSTPAPSETPSSPVPSETPSSVPSPSDSPGQPSDSPEQPGGELPRTGGTFVPMLALAGGLIVAGAAMLMIRRRKNNS